MSGGPTYDIRTVADFLAVPEDRIEACLGEFRAFLHMARYAPPLLEAIADEASGMPGAVRFRLHGGFRWTDDGEGQASVNIMVGDEQATLNLGTLKDEYRVSARPVEEPGEKP